MLMPKEGVQSDKTTKDRQNGNRHSCVWGYRAKSGFSNEDCLERCTYPLGCVQTLISVERKCTAFKVRSMLRFAFSTIALGPADIVMEMIMLTTVYGEATVRPPVLATVAHTFLALLPVFSWCW